MRVNGSGVWTKDDNALWIEEDDGLNPYAKKQRRMLSSHAAGTLSQWELAEVGETDVISAIYAELQPWLDVRRECGIPLRYWLQQGLVSLSLLLCHLAWRILIGSCTQRSSVFQLKMPLITECNNTLAFPSSKIMDLLIFANGLW